MATSLKAGGRAVDYSKINLFAMMQMKMRYDSERQGVLSQNIANADTPDYKPSDLKPIDFHKLAENESKKIGLEVTNPMHISPINKQSSFAEKKGMDFETTPSGNSVVVEQEAMKMTENNNDYQAVTAAYKNIANLFKIVTTGSSQ